MTIKGGTSGGVSFLGLLTIVFVVLKLTGYIDWSWWWVISPSLLGCLGGFFLVGVIFGIVILSEILGD